MEGGQISDLAETLPTNSTLSEFRKIFVNETNFTTLYDGSGRDGEGVTVDIIFVHGLGGGPKSTWSTSKPAVHPDDDQPPSSSSTRRYLGRIWSKSNEGKSAVLAEGSSTRPKHETFWPAEFLPAAFPRARILTWGYDSKVTKFFAGPVDQGSYYDHAKDLLYDVQDVRANDTRKRPIIWIAHSLGGIILKETLLCAQAGMGGNSSRSLKDIYESTRKVLFLGTPHRGSSMGQWGIIAESLVKAAGIDTNPVILKQIKARSPELGQLNEKFINLMRNSVFDVISFKESSGMGGIYPFNGKVVDDFSSGISGERQRFIPGNHTQMCKFSSKSDSGYRRIEAEVREIILQIHETTGEETSGQAERANLDTLGEPESLVTEHVKNLNLFELLMPDNSIFDNQMCLYDAIKNGDEPTARKLLLTGATIDDENLIFNSNLSLAISSGMVEVVELLLDHGADIEKKEPYSVETPLIKATRLKSHEIVKLLLQREANILSTDRTGKLPLHIACESGDRDLVDLLLQRLTGIEQKCSDFMDTPLLLATRSGQSATVDSLLQHGAFIEAVDSEGKSPLHLASELGDDKLAKLLLKAGANPETKDSRQQRTPLHYAAEKGNTTLVRDLLQSKAYINAQDSDGTTALHLAARLGHTEIVSLLVSKGANIRVQYYVSRITPLHLAAENGYDAAVKTLIEAGADAAATQYPSLDAKTPLHLAAQNGHHIVVSLLCQEGIVEKREKFSGNTPLLLSALGGHTLAAKVLLQKKAEVDARNYEGWTALYIALREGNEELALLLLSEGANTKWPGTSLSPLQYAAFVGQISVVQKLLDLGVDIEQANESGVTALASAATADHTDILSLLLSNKAKLDTQSSTGRTPLHEASSNGHVASVRLFLNCGADFNLSDNEGWTALHCAVAKGHEAVVRLLIMKGADCTSAHKSSVTPLHLAAASGYEDILKLLLEAGAVVDAPAFRRGTPLVFACRNGHESTARILLANGAQLAGPEWTIPLVGAAMGAHTDIIDLLQSYRGIDGGIGELEALHGAAYMNQALVIKKLLGWGGLDINATKADGVSALHYAASYGNDSAVQTLLEEGADVDKRSKIGWLPIHGAALDGHTSVIRLLLDAGSGVECLQEMFTEDLSSLRRSDPEGLVRLFVHFARATHRMFCAIKDGDVARIRELAADKISASLRDRHGNSTLHAAIQYNCTKAIQILCDIGTGKDLKNALERTALHDAVLKSNVEAQRLLLQNGSDINLKDRDGVTALHAAVATKHEASVKMLLEAGADVNIEDNLRHMSPLQYAEEEGYEAVLLLLKSQHTRDFDERCRD